MAGVMFGKKCQNIRINVMLVIDPMPHMDQVYASLSDKADTAARSLFVITSKCMTTIKGPLAYRLISADDWME